MSLAGGSSSRRAPSPRPSAAVADRGGGEGTSQAPPDTHFKSKVKWTWQRFDRSHVGAMRRSLTADLDASQVKGDDEMEMGDPRSMSEREACARVEQAAHEGGLQEETSRIWSSSKPSIGSSQTVSW